MDQAAHLGPPKGLAADQGRIRVDLVQELADSVAPGKGLAVRFDQDRHVARGVEGQELVAAVPDVFGPQFKIEPLFQKRDSYLSAIGDNQR